MFSKRTMIVGAVLALLATACGGGGSDGDADVATTVAEATADPAADAPDAEPRGTEPDVTETTEDTEVPPTTEAPTTTTPPTTTVAPIVDLVVDQVAEIPGRSIASAFTNGTTIIGLADTDNTEHRQMTSLVELDLAGNVLREAPVDQGSSVFSIVEANGQHWAFGSFMGENYSSECGFRQIDTAALALGPTLVTSADGSCGGGAFVDESDPAVIWTLGYGSDAVIKVDTATGVVTPLSVETAVPAGYEVQQLELVGTNGYVQLDAAYDDVTGDEVTAPDGSPLPTLIVRVDGATGTLAVQQIDGYLGATAGRLVVWRQGMPAQELDPTTLAPTDIGADELGDLPLGSATQGDGVAWTTDGYSGPGLTVVQRNPQTLRIVAEGEADTGFAEDAFVTYSDLPVGADLYVLAAQQVWDDEAEVTTSMTKLYHATAQPTAAG